MKGYPDVLWVRRYAVTVWPGTADRVVRELLAAPRVSHAFVIDECVMFDVLAVDRTHSTRYANSLVRPWALESVHHVTSERFRWAMEVHRA